MKFFLIPFLGILVMPINALAIQPQIEIIEQFDDLRAVAFIRTEDIEKSPVWNPGSGEPSLSVGEAIQAVKRFLNHAIDTREIELRPVPRYDTHWHYLVKVFDGQKKPKYSLYVVLMNGKVIPAIIEPEGYK